MQSRAELVDLDPFHAVIKLKGASGLEAGRCGHIIRNLELIPTSYQGHPGRRRYFPDN